MDVSVLSLDKKYNAEVVRVIDGDTYVVFVDIGFDLFKKTHVRLYGIDTPEKFGATKTEGLRIKKIVSDLILGKEVEIQVVKDKDKYGRCLATVNFNGQDMTQYLLKNKFGKEYYGGSKEVAAMNISIQSNENWLEQVNSIIENWKTTNFYKSLTLFNTLVIDILIQKIETFNLSGFDKKAAVLLALDKIFDAVIVTSLPFYLYPLRNIIKRLTISTSDIIIDFIVAKYNEGLWGKEATNEQEKTQM